MMMVSIITKIYYKIQKGLFINLWTLWRKLKKNLGAAAARAAVDLLEAKVGG